MAKKFDKDSFSGTLIVVLVVSLICSIIVAGAVVGLKPIQEKQKLQDKQGYILSVAGLMDKNTDISKTFAERIEQRVVDLATGEYVKDAPKDVQRAHRRQRPCPKYPNQTRRRFGRHQKPCQIH